MPFYQFPGTNFNDLNLDWLLQQMKTCLAEWAATKADWQALSEDNAAFKERIEAEWTEVKDYITNYFANLDISQEVADRINALVEDGTIQQLIVSSGEIQDATADWLSDHVNPETGYVIDTSLTVSDAAADAAVTGARTMALVSTVSKQMNTSVNNLWNPTAETVVVGYYDNGRLMTAGAASLYYTDLLPVTHGNTYYISWALNFTEISFFNSSKEYLSHTVIQSGNTIAVPDTDTIAYMAIPINRNFAAVAVVSPNPIVPGFNKYVSGTSKETDEILSSLSDVSASGIYTFNKSGNDTSCLNCVKFTSHETGWQAWFSGATEAIICGRGNIVIAHDATTFISVTPTGGKIYRMQIGSPSFENIGTFTPTSVNMEKEPYFIRLNKYSLIMVSLESGEKAEIDLLPFVTGRDKAELGVSLEQSQRTGQGLSILYAAGSPYWFIDSVWRGKTWYAYGTSITATGTGKYVNILAALSGMTAVNKGIGGGGIGNLGAYSHGQVYDAVCNDTDGKLDADIITLETGANDVNQNVPLGTIYDTGRDTLAGCLNDCIRYLQAHTDAQIVVIASPATTVEPNATTQYYAWRLMIEQICKINNVAFILPATNMGYAKLTSDSGSNYVVDNIHQTSLGGKVYANGIWSILKNMTRFFTS